MDPSTPQQDAAFPRSLRGKFIVFEGPDGSGKTTQFKRFLAYCAEHGVTVCEVREPGGTPIGEEIRQILLHTKQEMCLRTEMLLYMASRAQLIEQRIRPALARGELVLADRFIQSTYAYQGAAGGIPETEIRAVGGVALGGLEPHRVLIFDVDAATAAKRTRGVEKAGRKKAAEPAGASLFDDRIEQRTTADTHSTIRRSYLDQAEANPAAFRVIDASKDPESVWAALLGALA
ncbi:MAG: dTMP kinase [Phycisphaerales bacterium]